jgi:addiction module HigA family antidote
MSRMYNPPHPGETLLEDVIPALGLTIKAAAEQLGISRVQLSRVLHGHAPISPDLALRLEQWIAGPTADIWLKMQTTHDLWLARQSGLPRVMPAKRLPDAVAH